MLRLGDIMTRELVTVAPELSLRKAIELLAQRHVSGLPVVAGSRVVGVLSTSDVLALLASVPGVPTGRTAPEDPWEEEPPREEPDDGAAYYVDLWSDAGADLVDRFEATDGPEWDLLGEYTVSSAMTRTLLALSSETALSEGAAFMARHGVHRVLVVDQERLAGVVTTTDIMWAVARRRLVDPSVSGVTNAPESVDFSV